MLSPFEPGKNNGFDGSGVRIIARRGNDFTLRPSWSHFNGPWGTVFSEITAAILFLRIMNGITMLFSVPLVNKAG